MRIQYMSDTHIEMSNTIPKLEKHGDVLILAGDIGNPFQTSYTDFLQQASDLFPRVYVIAGNHEYYGGSIADTDAKIASICDKLSNVKFLQCHTDVYNGVRFVGCTLWSQVKDSLRYKMNDFLSIFTFSNSKIRLFQPADVRDLHEHHVKWLTACTNSHTFGEDGSNIPTVVITHHAPLDDMNGVFRGGTLSSGFATNLSHMFQPPIVAWICGHTHQNMTVHVNNIPCISNCKGYSGEDIYFNPKAFIDI